MTTETAGQGGTEERQGISTMVVGRVIGWLFLAAAIATLGWDIADAFGDGYRQTPRYRAAKHLAFDLAGSIQEGEE